jgi:hypothetical protein
MSTAIKLLITKYEIENTRLNLALNGSFLRKTNATHFAMIKSIQIRLVRTSVFLQAIDENSF